MISSPHERNQPLRLSHRWLLLLPFVWQALLAPAVNDIAWRPLGMPFAMAWQMAGIVFASVVIAIVFRLDAAAGVDEEEAAFLAECSRADGEPA